MQSGPLTSLNFDDFPTIYGAFDMPKNTILCRGHTGAAVDDWPMYFTSNPAVAKSYAGARGKVSYVSTKKRLRLFDLRYVRLVIQDVVGRRKCADPDAAAGLKSTLEQVLLAYGGCSLDTQMRLMRKEFGIPDSIDIANLDDASDKAVTPYKNMGVHHARCRAGDGPCWVNPVEPQGVRLGESNVDMKAVLFLRDTFSGVIDGYIAPALDSPFQLSGVINSEIVLFHPPTAVAQVTDLKTEVVGTTIRDVLAEFKVPEFFTVGESETVEAWADVRRLAGGSRRNRRRKDPAELYHDRKTRKSVVEAAAAAKAAADELKTGASGRYVDDYLAVRVRPKKWTQQGGEGRVGGHP